MDDKFSDELLRMMEAQNAMDEFCETDAMLEDYEVSVLFKLSTSPLPLG